MGDDHNVTGEIPVSYDKFVLEDIRDNIVYKKSNIASHYELVMSTRGKTYNGVSKRAYGDILQAIKTIVDCEINHVNCIAKEHATAFLHGEMLFASVSIQNILSLFGIKIPMSKILEDANKVFSYKPEPVWMQKILGGHV
jgi:hypothetical protein